MALSVTITRMLPFYPNGVFLQWSLDEAVESGAYVATVYRSGSPAGPWELCADDLVEEYHYLDALPPAPNTNPLITTEEVTQLSLSLSIYYRIRITPPSGPDNAVEAIRAVEAELTGRQRLIKRKLLRDESVLLAKYNGVPVAILKKKHWGTRCPKCYDKASKESIRSSCRTCFGTTFVDGYFAPMITLAKRATTPNQVGMTPQGKAEIATTRVTLLDLPAVQDDDILVFLRDNRRFITKRMLPTELQTVTVHQVLEVSELPRSHVVYAVKVDPNMNPQLF